MRLQFNRGGCKDKRLVFRVEANLDAVVVRNRDASVEKGRLIEKDFAFSYG